MACSDGGRNWGYDRGQVRANSSSSNYPAKRNFRMEVKKIWPNRNAWVSTGTTGRDRIKRKIELKGVELLEVYCIEF